jgi:nucleoside-diphosphate-sugar epimerase
MFALVTGASGFLGGHLVERLCGAGHRVRAMVRDRGKARFLEGSGAEFVLADVTAPETLAAALEGVEVVFHSAALVSNWAPWSEFQATTVQGTENLLQAAIRVGVKRFVHISTIRVYDDRSCPQNSVIAEDVPIGKYGFRDFGNYARAKAEGEAVVWRFASQLPVSVIRPSWIYGPRDDVILPPLLRWLRDPGSYWPGHGDPCADPIYVTDVADCTIAAALHPAAIGQAYHAAPHEHIRLRAFLAALCERCGVKLLNQTFPYYGAVFFTHLFEAWARLTRRGSAPSLNYAGLAMLTRDIRHSPAKAERDLGWRSQVSVADGLDQTVRWLTQTHPELIPSASPTS